MSDYYECTYCGKKFEMASKRDSHEDFCGMSRLSDFDDEGGFRRLENMSDALRRNDYSDAESSGQKIKQKTLQ